MADAAEIYFSAFTAGLRPDPPMTVDEWADEFRYLSAKASAEPGRYRTDRAPYLREIMRCLSPASPVQEIVFKKSSQVGGSEIGFNWIGYIIDRAPGPTMMVQPTVELAKRNSKQRIAPMIEDSPVLRARFAGAKQKDSDDTLLSKEFPGGILQMTGANSASGLANMPVKNLFLDEIDRYPRDVDGEGDPVALAEKRTTTFPRRKVFKNSTPTYEGASPIDEAWELSDKRRFHVPCPHCGHRQHLKWGGMVWDTDAGGKAKPETARYRCEGCKGEFAEHHKGKMLASGEWIPENPGAAAAGFHINALYSPLGWYSWTTAVKEWREAQGRPEKLKVFANTVLGETYKAKAEDAPQWRELYARREEYPIGVVPARAVLLTAACDVQGNRLEVTISGWNRREWWVIAHIEIPGNTSEPADQGPWKALDDLLYAAYPHESGLSLRISRLAIDTGFNTTRVYEWIRRHSGMLVMAIKGQSTLNMPIGTPKAIDVKINGRRIKRGIRLWMVGTNVLKSEFYGRMKMGRPTDTEIAEHGFPTNYFHFPMLGEEYFKQLTAEQLTVGISKTGHARYEWVKVYPNNEALDCACYNLAAYWGYGAARWTDERWAELEAQFKVEEKAPAEPKSGAAPAQPAPAPQKPRPRRESDYWG